MSGRADSLLLHCRQGHPLQSRRKRRTPGFRGGRFCAVSRVQRGARADARLQRQGRRRRAAKHRLSRLRYRSAQGLLQVAPPHLFDYRSAYTPVRLATLSCLCLKCAYWRFISWCARSSAFPTDSPRALARNNVPIAKKLISARETSPFLWCFVIVPTSIAQESSLRCFFGVSFSRRVQMRSIRRSMGGVSTVFVALTLVFIARLFFNFFIAEC